MEKLEGWSPEYTFAARFTANGEEGGEGFFFSSAEARLWNDLPICGEAPRLQIWYAMERLPSPRQTLATGCNFMSYVGFSLSTSVIISLSLSLSSFPLN